MKYGVVNIEKLQAQMEDIMDRWYDPKSKSVDPIQVARVGILKGIIENASSLLMHVGAAFEQGRLYGNFEKDNSLEIPLNLEQFIKQNQYE